MKAFNFNKTKSNKNLNLCCTLLIPKWHLNKLINLKKNFTIEEILKNYSILIQKKIIFIKPIQTKHTTSYQYDNENELHLSRSHFRCDPMVWHRFKRLANHYGVSICKLFVLCLISNENLRKTVGTPADSRWFCFLIFFEITNYKLYKSFRIFFSRINRN